MKLGSFNGGNKNHKLSHDDEELKHRGEIKSINRTLENTLEDALLLMHNRDCMNSSLADLF